MVIFFFLLKNLKEIVMLTIHPMTTGKKVILSEEEFELIIEKLLQIDQVEIVIDDDPDCLTEQKLEQLNIAEAEFENGETVSWENLKKDFSRRRKDEVSG